MKKIALAILMVGPLTPAMASPYFRIAKFGNLHPVAGALLDVGDLKKSELAGLVPLVTHTPADGCMLPSIVCEDWTPFAVGGGMNAGYLTFEIAPLANVLPWMAAAALAAIPEKFDGARAIFKPAQDQQAVTFSAGPVWEYQERTNKGYFKLFTGLALHFQ